MRIFNTTERQLLLRKVLNAGAHERSEAEISFMNSLMSLSERLDKYMKLQDYDGLEYVYQYLPDDAAKALDRYRAKTAKQLEELEKKLAYDLSDALVEIIMLYDEIEIEAAKKGTLKKKESSNRHV